MAEGPDNTTSRWQQLKTKFLSLTLRTQIFLAIGVVALIAVIVVTATEVIYVENDLSVDDVTIRFVPTNRDRVPGQTLIVEMVIDTKGENVSAVQAVFDIKNKDVEPLPRLDLTCTTDNCNDIIIGPAWGTTAELRRVGDTVTIAVGNLPPVSGDGILVATIYFHIPPDAPYGWGWADFDPTRSFIIKDDGLGTNIIDSVQSEDWEIVESLPIGSITIDSGPGSVVEDCGTPDVEVLVNWITNVLADSNIAWNSSGSICGVGCTWSNFYNNFAEGTMHDPDLDTEHTFRILGLEPDRIYRYMVMSSIYDPVPTGSWAVSDEEYFYTGCVLPPADKLEMDNLSVTPSARLALVTWTTNLLANSRVFNLDPVNNNGNDDFFDPTFTLSHSITIPSLEPYTSYCIDVSSTSVPPVPEPPDNYDADFVCFDTESEDLSLDANIVLKVNRDRVCNQWLSCASSVGVKDSYGESRDLCFDYALCEELDVENNGECTKLISAFAQETALTLEFTLEAGSPTSTTIRQAKNLTGFSKAGAKWQGRCSNDSTISCTSKEDCADPGNCESVFPALGIAPGSFPVPNMSQLGSAASIPNGDFEAGFAYPWGPRYRGDGLEPTVQTVTDRTVLAADFNQVLSIRPNSRGMSGVIIPLGNSLNAGKGEDDPVEYYVAFDTRTADNRFKKIFVEFGYHCTVDLASGLYKFSWVEGNWITPPLSAGWQKVLAGPLKMKLSNLPEPEEETCLVLSVWQDPGDPPDFKPFYVDNIKIQPVLRVKDGGTDVSPESHVSRSCRQYPSEDAPACRYFDINSSQERQGWEGYCLQTDPSNERRCLQWVPIDLIAGSSPAFAAYGQAGYGTEPEDRTPLYYCTQSRGNAPYIRNVTIPYRDYEEANWATPDDYYDVKFWLLNRLWKEKSATEWDAFGWSKESKLKLFDDIYDDKDRALTQYTTTYNFRNVPNLIRIENPNPLYIYDIEQIALGLSGPAPGDPDLPLPGYPTGLYYLNHGNGFEKAWCMDPGDTNGCPPQDSVLKDPKSKKWWWQKLVTDQNACHDLESKGLNILGVKAKFDPDSGVFLGLRTGLCDGQENAWGYVDIQPYFYLREWCTEIAQVVDPFGNNTAWAERVHSNLYSVPELGYQKNRDMTPFGGIVAPEPDHDPSRWDYSGQERGRQPLMIEPADKVNFPTLPHQARVSSPYGGSSSCDEDNIKIGRAVCVSGQKERLGEPCLSNTDCGYGDDLKVGRCTGVVPPGNVYGDYFFEKLECPDSESPIPVANLFAKSERVWKWSTSTWQYKVDTDLGWDYTDPDSEIGRQPRVENFTIKGGSGHTIDTDGNIVFGGKFGKVTATFNSVVDPNQVPLTRYTVDWGDDSVSEESNLKIAPQSSQPHVLTHTYSCLGTEGCTFTPKVQIEDNWTWCSGVIVDGNSVVYSGGGERCDIWDFFLEVQLAY